MNGNHIMITSAKEKIPSKVFHTPPSLVGSQNKASENGVISNKKLDYLSPLIAAKKSIVKNPSFYIVYKFAPGFHKVSVSFELNHSNTFLNTFG